MIPLSSQTTVWLYNLPADMRCSYNGLIALTKTKLKENPASGQLFVFINKRRSQMKCLYYDQGGYCLWCKRLEQGRFEHTMGIDQKSQITKMELAMLIEGIDLSSIKRRKRYHKNMKNQADNRIITQ